MSAIIHLPEIRLALSVPGATPAAGLASALECIRDALAAFAGTPAPEAFGAALSGIAWQRHAHLLRMLPRPTPQPRTTHLIVVGLSGSPSVSISSVISDGEDEPLGQIHEGQFVCADILRDVPTIVRALT